MSEIQTTSGSAGATTIPARCPHCGQSHATKCPLVKAVEYHQDGTMKRIEFFAPVDYPPFKIAEGFTTSLCLEKHVQ